jgi:hypothetical protein
MEFLMNRFIGGMLIGALAVGLGLGTIGCQGGDTGPGSKDEGIKKAKEAGERTRQMQEKMKDKRGGAAPAGATDDDDKTKDKSDDKK